MARKHEFIELKDDELAQIDSILSKGNHPSRKVRRARILILNHNGHSLNTIPEKAGCSRGTVYRIIRCYKEGGLELALNEKPRPGRPIVFSGLERAKITALACSEAPQGRQRWTLRLLADKAVELNYIEADSIHNTTIHKILKKTD